MKKIGLILLLAINTLLVVAQPKDRTIFEDVEFNVYPSDLLNTLGSDITPAFVESELFYTGIDESDFKNSSEASRGMAFYNIYSSNLDEDGVVISERKLVPGFGKKVHEGPAAYCSETKELFLTLSSSIKPMKRMFYFKDIRLKLVIAKRINGRWEIKEELPFNDKAYNCAHPAISVTGDTLLFASNMKKDSYGGSDLYMSVRNNGKWSAPQNLGDSINTAGNEMYPTYIDNEIITFASDGRPNGQGKLDIWYTSFPKEGEIINMGNKVNSYLDDFGLVIHPNKSIGYFSSEVSVIGEDDIYTLEIKKLYRTFNGKVVDDETGEPVPYSKVDLIDCNSKIIRSVITDNIGSFSFEVIETQCPQIEVNKEGYDFNRKSILELDFLEIRLKSAF